MDSTKATLMDVQAYITNLIKDKCHEKFKDFLPPNYTPTVQKNSFGDSEFTTPCSTQIFNMCAKKDKWPYKEIKEVAEEIVKDFKDEKDIIGSVKITVQAPPAPKKEKKDNKKEEGEKKEGDKKEGDKKKGGDDKKGKKKEKVLPTNIYIDIYLNVKWEEETAMNVLRNGIHLVSEFSGKHVAVDFSSPNIAKEMHVGHLRSTILGESICRVLEFLGNKVERINHVGDWGTQFGMLIAYLEEINPNYADEPEKCGNIKDLEGFYKDAKKKFDDEPEFKKKSQLKTVDLQKGDENARKAWKFICQVSRDNFEKVYKLLNIKLTEIGESFYDPICRKLIPELEEKGFVVEDKGAKILRIKNFKNPLILVKSDGGIGYDTTDMAALNYRINELKADWIIYVVASEQNDHFKMVFKAGEMCKFYEEGKVRLDHMGFGLVKGEDGKKIATRKGGSTKLIDLLDEGAERAQEEMRKRNEKNSAENKMTEEYIKEAAVKLSTSSIRYYDLKQFRTSGYKFEYDKMLDDKGNTGVYLFYSYARICSMYKKNNLSEKDIEELIKNEKIVATEPAEKKLLAHLLLFNDVIDEVCKGLALNLLCDYVYGIATKFSEFYEACKIAGNNSRILLTELCKRFMKQSFDLLGLTPIEKI